MSLSKCTVNSPTQHGTVTSTGFQCEIRYVHITFKRTWSLSRFGCCIRNRFVRDSIQIQSTKQALNVTQLRTLTSHMLSIIELEL